MPWLSIIMALLAFFSSKESGASNTKALLTAGLAGAGTYYVSHETDWGKANLGALDGVDTVTTGAIPLKNPDGTPRLNPDGTQMFAQDTTKSIGSTTAEVLKSWGGTGTAAVLGTAAVASGALDIKPYLPWALGALALLLIMK